MITISLQRIVISMGLEQTTEPQRKGQKTKEISGISRCMDYVGRRNNTKNKDINHILRVIETVEKWTVRHFLR